MTTLSPNLLAVLEESTTDVATARTLPAELYTSPDVLAFGLQHEIGSLEVGKRADIVVHDTDRPEWRPLHNVVNQLVWSADGRGVHSVIVDGRIVVDDGHVTTIDEKALWAEAQRRGEEIVGRSGCPTGPKFPVC